MTEALEILFTASFWVAAIRIASPLIFATMGELICERAGVLNLGIEGIMTVGAFAGWFTVYSGGDLWMGVIVAALAGGAFGLLHAFLTVTPDGTALPCHTAKMLPGLAFPNVREVGVREIWYDSEGFNRYRGDAWMKEPCRSCPEKEKDLGGCRCQAYLLAGDPAAADPVCDKSPAHAVVAAAVAAAERPDRPDRPGVGARPLVFRDPAASRRIAASGSCSAALPERE